MFEFFWPAWSLGLKDLSRVKESCKEGMRIPRLFHARQILESTIESESPSG